MDPKLDSYKAMELLSLLQLLPTQQDLDVVLAFTEVTLIALNGTDLNIPMSPSQSITSDAEIISMTSMEALTGIAALLTTTEPMLSTSATT